MNLMIDETGRFDKYSSRSLVCGWLTSKTRKEIEFDLIELAKASGLRAECPAEYFHTRKLQNRADHHADYDGVIPFLETLSSAQSKDLLDSFRGYSFANGTFFEAEMAGIGIPSESMQENYERTLAELMGLISKHFTMHNLAARVNIIIHGRNPKLYPLAVGETRAIYEAKLCAQIDSSNSNLDSIEIIPSNASPWKKLASVPADFAAWYCGEQYDNINPDPTIIRSRDSRQPQKPLTPFEQWRFATKDDELALFSIWIGSEGIDFAKARELLSIADSFVDLRANITYSLEKAKRIYTMIKHRIEIDIDTQQSEKLPIWIQAQKGLITSETIEEKSGNREPEKMWSNWF